MDQPGAAAGWASAGAREATASPRPSHPRGDADDAEASDATSAPREAQAGSAQPSGDAPAPGTVEAAPKKPRPVLKPLLPDKPPSAVPAPVRSASTASLKALPPVSPAVSATVTPAQSTTVTPRGAVAAESDASLKTKKEAAEPSPKKEEGAISSPRAPDAAPSEVLVEAVENTEIVPAEEGDTIVAQPRPPPAVASTPDEEIVLLRAQLKQQEEQLQKLMSRVEGAASDGSGSQRSAEGATAGAPAATGSKHHPVKRILQPETIPEMEVLEDNQMSSDFTLRMKRPSTLAARGRSKSSVIHSKRRDPDKLSDEMRLFMTTWREAREHEIRSTIVEDLRRAYIKLAKEDEECKEFNLVLTSLADIEGTSKGVCEYLRHRLRGSFKVVPEEVVLVRPMALPGQVAAAAADAAGLASGGWVAGLDDAGLATASAADSLLNDTTSSEPDVEGRARESLLDGHVTRKRFRHELARALRSHDDHPCVRVLIQNEKPAKMAYQGAERDLDKDLFDINHFCDKYGNLDRWARNTAKLEAHGIRQVVHFLQEPASDKGRAEHGPAFMLGAPKDQRSDNDVAMIETSRDFLSFFFTGDEEMKHKADISRLGRMDACNWVKAVLAKRNQLQQDKDKDAMGSDPDHVFDPASLLVNSDPCAFAPTHLMRALADTPTGSTTASQAPSTSGDVLAGHLSNRINLYALFPAWHADEHVSVKQFIKHWLVHSLKVPLSNDGSQWDRGLGKPLLNVKVGGVTAKCIGTSGAQWALLKGQCCMSVLPLDSHDAVKLDADLLQRSVSQVVCAYKQYINPGSDDAQAGHEPTCLGPYQAVVTADGCVFVDCEHLRHAAPKTAAATMITLLDDAEHSSKQKMAKVLRLEEEFVVQVGMGKGHFLCLTSEGRIWAFGNSLQGQMGYLATTLSPTWNVININTASNSPSLPLAAKVVQVACGADHSLAVVDNGLVYGFGSNCNGQLGLPDSSEVYEPTVILKFERMSNRALLNAKGTYVRSDFDTVAADIPWIVSVSCGDKHSVMLTASGRIFACGDNSSGQIGYSGTVQDADDLMYSSEGAAADPDHPASLDAAAAADNINVSEILQFHLPVLVEGGHVPKSIAQVACGSRHTSVLSHTGRIYIYGGVTEAQTRPCSTAKCGGNIMWRSVHEKSNLYLDADAYASSLVYHGDPYKMVNLSCSGDYTLASFFDSERGSVHSSPGYLDLASFWWTHPDGVVPAMHVAQLQFQLQSTVPESTKTGEQDESLDELHAHLLDEIKKCGPRVPVLTRNKSITPRGVQEPSHRRQFHGVSPSQKQLERGKPGTELLANELEDMAHLIELIQAVTRLYVACRSQYPVVREEAVTLWGSPERFLLCGPAQGGLLPGLSTPFRNVVSNLLNLDALDANARRQFVIGCQLVLYRATVKRNSLPKADVDYLLSIGISRIWRPHLLHDKAWSPSMSLGSASSTAVGPFVLLEDMVLLQKLENAGAAVYVDSKVIIDAIKELSPRSDLAMLFLMRRANISNVSTVAMAHLLSKEYVVEVRTGNGPNSGTDSQVFVELVGTLGSSGERALVYSDNTNAFESAQTDIFTLSSTELGHIKKLVVRNEGAAAKSKWKLDEIRVWQAGNPSLVYDFPYYGWMDARIPSDVMRQELWFDPVPKARERYQYEIKVATMDAPHAGTNSSVFVILYGEVADSRRQRLEETVGGRTYRLFQKGQTSTFMVPVSHDMGVLCKMVIGTTSWGLGASWLVESVEVTRFRKGPAQEDFTRETSTYKFRNRNKAWISQQRACCHLELFPEADSSRAAGGAVATPVISPIEGVYRKSVDICLATSELDSEVVLTAFYVPDSDREGRVKGIDWLKSAENRPRALAEAQALVLTQCVQSEAEPEAERVPKGNKKAGSGAHRVRRHYELPSSFYDADEGATVTFRMKGNENLRLDRSGGTYRIMVKAVKFASGSESYSEVAASGEISIAMEERPKLYRVHVFTGNFPEAGTSANVSIIIKGKNGAETQPIDLNWANALVEDKTKAPASGEGEGAGAGEVVSDRKAARAQAFLAKGGRKLGKMLGLFDSNSEAVFDFEAEDVGEVAEVLIWHDNRHVSILTNPEWYLHRVEVEARDAPPCPTGHALAADKAKVVGEDGSVDLMVDAEAESVVKPEASYMSARRGESEHVRTFMCRKWLTSRDTQLGTQARLVYSELKHYAKLIETYDFAIVLPKKDLDKHKNMPFEKLVLFGDRIRDGLQINLPNLKLERVFSLDSVMFCYKSHVGRYFGVLRGAMFVDRGGSFVPASRGMRLMVTCYEKATYNTVHFVPALVDDSFAANAVASMTAGCSPLWGAYGELKTMLRISGRQHAVEPTVAEDGDIVELHEGETGDRPLFAQEKKDLMRLDGTIALKQRKDSTRTILNTLEIWSNILESEDFDEEESLQRMIPACARLTLVAVAKHGALYREHLDKLKFVFNMELYPMENAREVEAHSDLAIMSSVFAHLDKWRRIEPNTYELEEVKFSNCFAWNLLYWQCCTNAPEPEGIAFVLENAGFDNKEDDIESGQAKFVVEGIEADFALMLHYLVLRQMARYDVLALEQEQSEAARRKAMESLDNRNLGWRRRWSRRLNIYLRSLSFPIISGLAIMHILFIILVAAVVDCGWNYYNDRRRFSQFAEDGVLQPTKDESRRLAEKWRQVCSGNFMWLKRRCPITQDERRRQERRHQLVGKWTDLFFELRRQFMMAIMPQITHILKSMMRWFSIGTTRALASALREKSSACRKREAVLEELCRFSPVSRHRNNFAVKLFMRGGLKNFVLLVMLVYCLFHMLGLGWYRDEGSDLAADLRQMLVDDDFDDEHNTFNEIDKWEDWWNFARGSLAGMLTAQQAYQGGAYAGDLRLSPVLLRQVRTEPDAQGILPVWPGHNDLSLEDTRPLEVAMCKERKANETRDGCVWSVPPNANYLSAYTRGARYRGYPASGYMVQLTGGDVLAQLQRLDDGGWFDAATRFVSVEAMVYSKSRDRMAYVNLAAEISVTGWANPVVQIISWKPPDGFGVWHWIFMLIFVQTLGNEALCILDLGPRRYFTGAGNWVNLLMAGCIFSVFVCQMVVITEVSKYDRFSDNPWPHAPGQPFNINWPLVTMVQVQRVCAAISILIWFLKFLVHLNTMPVCGPIVLGIFELLRQPVILFFFFCYMWMLFGFALCFFFLSPDAIDQSFAQGWQSMSTMLRAGLSGDFEFTTYEAMDSFAGPVLFIVMIIMSQIFMTNLFIAIISNEYEVARQKGERKWKNMMAYYMAQELIDSLPVDSSGSIDMHSSAMLVGHDIRVGNSLGVA